MCIRDSDIVTRYDVDAIHMDEYFYPYPNPGEDFPDHVSFEQYGRGYSTKADWRRDNVNVLIKEIHETVRECKPWVKFGVSPFGIYRNCLLYTSSHNLNMKSVPPGSLRVEEWTGLVTRPVSYTHLDVYKRQDERDRIDYIWYYTENGGVFHFQPLFGIIPNVIYTCLLYTSGYGHLGCINKIFYFFTGNSKYFHCLCLFYFRQGENISVI